MLHRRGERREEESSCEKWVKVLTLRDDQQLMDVTETETERDKRWLESEP
jgi:hypothetical protein